MGEEEEKKEKLARSKGKRELGGGEKKEKKNGLAQGKKKRRNSQTKGGGRGKGEIFRGGEFLITKEKSERGGKGENGLPFRKGREGRGTDSMGD